jgi:transcriptional regulator with XRE-family HTH domain
VPALQNFFRDERQRRSWSIRDASTHCRMSLSRVYGLENGDDNVEFETFENIASAFGMTPAELAVAIGKGRPDDDPDEARLLAAYRQMPQEHRPTVIQMLHSLAVQPLRPPAKRRTPQDAMRPGEHARELTGSHEPGTDDGNNTPVRVAHRWVNSAAALLSHLTLNTLPWPVRPAAGIIATT